MNKIQYDEIMAFHPGYYLKDMIEAMGITQEEFAKRLGTSGKTLSELLNGKINLSDSLALNLSKMFGTSVEVWLNLQKTYTRKVLEIDRRISLKDDLLLVKEIDYSYFVGIGAVPSVKKPAEKVDELLKYLNVSSLNVLSQPDFLVNYRTAVSNSSEKNRLNSNAWVQTALNIGSAYETNSFDLKKLRQKIPVIRRMTLQKPEQFVPELMDLFHTCGVSFVILPYLKNSGVNGAVKWVHKDKVILAINNRRKYADTFWFSLFHEIGHVLQQKVAMLIVSRDVAEMDEVNQSLEMKADEFAQNTLIPAHDYASFIQKDDFSESAIKAFSKAIGIHPGIVVGRLQRDKIIRNDFLNHLKETYEILVQ